MTTIQIYKELIRLVLRHKIRLILGVTCMLTFTLFAVAPAKYMKDIVDSLTEDHNPSTEKFFLVGLALVAVFLLKGIFYFGQSFLMTSLGLKIIHQLRSQLFEKLIHMPLQFYQRRGAGRLVSHFTADLNHLTEAVIMSISGPLRDLPQIVLLLGLMLTRSWKLFLLTATLLPLVAWMIKKFGVKNKGYTEQRLHQYSEITNLLGEVTSGIRIVKAFHMEEYEKQRFHAESKLLFRQSIKSIRIESYSTPLLELVGGFTAAMIFTYGGYLVIHQEITGGDFASFLLSFFMLYDPIKKLNGFTLKVQEGTAAGARIFEVLHADWEVVDQPQAQVLPPFSDKLEISIQRFRYDPKQPQNALENIQLTIPKGQRVALVGASGSGKSTLANLIPRFYEIPAEDGRITIDGMDIRDCTKESLRSQIAMVNQEVVLFNDTISANISYGREGSSQAEIEEAAKSGQAHEFIERLPKQYQELIGEKGVNLSGGQRQRLSISRALIREAPILILDEATSALDNESEKAVQQAFDNLMEGRTSLVIAHRLATIQNADVIYVLKEGRIVESGTHDELVQLGGEYAQLYRMQFRT